MIALNNIGLYFDGEPIFKGISMQVTPKDRIGLVGKNGAGKSTLLNVISGRLECDEGSVTKSGDLVIGYLDQEFHPNETITLREYALTAYQEETAIEAEMEQLSKSLETRTDYESDTYAAEIERITELSERLAVVSDSEKDGKVEQILKGLGFKEEELDKAVILFSGGWQMRVQLARILLMKPDVLLLDEPTNHLDIQTIMWLENFLTTQAKAVILISHDRAFLDNVTNRTVEIVKGSIYDYPAPYSRFLELRQDRIDQQLAAKVNQDKYIAQQEEFIQKFKAKASKARQAQSKMKQVEKIERIEIDEEDSSKLNIRFPEPSRSGKVSIRMEGVGKAYGPKRVFSDVKMEIERGQKVAFLGANGEGKSTLVRIITEGEDCEGTVEIGHNVDIGYFAQVQEHTMNGNMTIRETIEAVAVGDWTKEDRIRGLLGAFLFRGDEITKRVKVLSGGEKSRLAMARLMMQEANLLILDEPTNHLDIASKERLRQALIQFQGTVILVSHDRDFLQGLADRVFEFKDARVKEYIGGIDDFLEKKGAENMRMWESAGKQAKQEKLSKKESSNKQTHQQKKQDDKATRNLDNAISKMEKEIDKHETALKQIESDLAQEEDHNSQKVMDLYYKHGETKKLLDAAMVDWEKLVEQKG